MKNKQDKAKEKEIVTFKSLPKYYNKEKSGKKPNTIRERTNEDKFLDLETKRFIRIVNTETRESFVRKIKDFSYWKEFVIISWETEQQKEIKELKKKLKDVMKAYSKNVTFDTGLKFIQKMWDLEDEVKRLKAKLKENEK